MNFIKRLAYYLGGFAIGLVILFFFLGGKDASCDYSPNSRVLKNIRVKKRLFSEATLQKLQSLDLDTAAVSNLLVDGNVLFSESDTETSPCNQYVIEGTISEKTLKMTVKNCSETATIVSID